MKMTPLLRMHSCDYLGDSKLLKKTPRPCQKVGKRSPQTEEFFFFLQNGRNRAGLQNSASDIFQFYLFPIFYPFIFSMFFFFFQLQKAITKALGKKKESLRRSFVAVYMMSKCANFHDDISIGSRPKLIPTSAMNLSQ